VAGRAAVQWLQSQRAALDEVADLMKASTAQVATAVALPLSGDQVDLGIPERTGLAEFSQANSKGAEISA
jgi:hypothetical protein